MALKSGMYGKGGLPLARSGMAIVPNGERIGRDCRSGAVHGRARCGVPLSVGARGRFGRRSATVPAIGTHVSCRSMTPTLGRGDLPGSSSSASGLERKDNSGWREVDRTGMEG